MIFNVLLWLIHHTVRSSLQYFNFYANYFCLNVSKRLQVQIGSFSHTVEKDEDERDSIKSTYTLHMSPSEVTLTKASRTLKL